MKTSINFVFETFPKVNGQYLTYPSNDKNLGKAINLAKKIMGEKISLLLYKPTFSNVTLPPFQQEFIGGTAFK